MQIKYVHYAVDQSTLDHWLVAGPQPFTVTVEALRDGKDPAAIARMFADPELHIADLPVERGPLTAGHFQIGDYTGSWEYAVCGEDHRVDQSGYVPVCTFLRSWAYTQLYSKIDQPVSMELVAVGPVHAWLNGELLFTAEDFNPGGPAAYRFSAQLRKGANPLFIRFETVAAGHSTHYFTARVVQPADAPKSAKLEVRIPTLIKTVSRRKRLESMFQTLYTDRDLYAWEQMIALNWPPAQKAGQEEELTSSAIRLIHESGRIYAEAEVDGTPGDQLKLGLAGQSPEGFYDIVMMPKFWELYEHDLRITHKLRLWNAGRRQFAVTPVGDFTSRKAEALQYAARQETGSLERETARMALALWDMVEEKVWQAALERVAQRQESSLRDLFGLLTMRLRFGDQPQFPADLMTSLAHTALAYRFDLADAGLDAVDRSGESGAILSAVCQLLAGQCWPEAQFTASGLKGSQLRQRGEEQTLAWLRQRATWGFTEYGSETGVETIAACLVALVDLAESEPVWELGGALLDKLFFLLALNSHQGVYGGTSSWISAWAVKGGLKSAFSALAYLLWGQGMLSPGLLGLVNLACSPNYNLPELFSRIATQPLEELWSRECHSAGEGLVGTSQAAFKTPGGLLSSLQDFQPGQPGHAEHVWQATLGPGAVVFTNHPGCSGETEAQRPGFWRGNGSLPRVAQWRDALICLYHLPKDAALNFTHAYFPTAAFDEYLVRGKWALARRGNTYLAISAENGLELVKRGPHAYRELRSDGASNAWFCQLGNAARDGSFAHFQALVLDLSLETTGELYRWSTLSGDQMQFSWKGKLLVNGSEHTLHGIRHIENLYTTVDFPCSIMEIQAGEEIMRLRLD
jgi:hypothetical protein